MICGVPVVATAVNAVPDLVVPGSTGLLVPRPARLLAGAIRSLLDSPADAARMAQAARARVGDRYGQRELRDALCAAYLPAASSSRPAGPDLAKPAARRAAAAGVRPV